MFFYYFINVFLDFGIVIKEICVSEREYSGVLFTPPCTNIYPKLVLYTTTLDSLLMLSKNSFLSFAQLIFVIASSWIMKMLETDNTRMTASITARTLSFLVFDSSIETQSQNTAITPTRYLALTG